MPEFDNGSSVLEYWLEMLNIESGDWDLIDITPNLSYTVSVGIETGVSYLFRVKGMNEIGLSDPSDEHSVIAARVPDVPEGL